MYYIIFCRGKIGDSSSNQKMNRQYKKKSGKKTNNGRQNTMQRKKLK